MKRRLSKLIILIMIFVLVASCSISREPFDDKKIIFKVVDTQISDYQISKSIEITNKTGYDLEKLSMKISYPIKTEDIYENGASNVISLKSGENLTITFPVPIGNIKSIDLENPEIGVNGYFIQGFEKVPFGIVGSLNIIAE